MKNLKSAPLKYKLLIFVISISAIFAPVWLAIHQSWIKSQSAAMERVLGYARDVQNRTDTTTDQIVNGIHKLQDSNPVDPCSKQQIAIMRDIDLSSSYLQAIGHVSGDMMDCSSLGTSLSGWFLGPVDFVTSRGAKVRANVKIPFAPTTTYTVIEQYGYAAIIHKNLPLDATTGEEDVSLAIFSLDNHRVISSRGLVKREWIEALGDQSSLTFSKDGYVVAVIRSEKYRTGALAALPTKYINNQMSELAWTLVPVGFICGLVLAFAVISFASMQMSMPVMLKSAMQRREFFVLYQPVVNLQTGKCVGAEALLRWRRVNGEMIPPDVFIPVAEATGLIQQITKHVIQLIGHDAADLFRKHPNFHLALNLSPSDFHDEHTIEMLQYLVGETSAGSGNLIVEATERGLMKADVARKMIRKIHENRIRIALDDFGTGYSSLSYLEKFNIDFLKIDKSFVDKIGTEAPTSNVVQHIIDIAKEMNLIMVAEGVETEEQAQFLREQGVQYAQGWLFGKPMSLGEAIQRSDV